MSATCTRRSLWQAGLPLSAAALLGLPRHGTAASAPTEPAAAAPAPPGPAAYDAFPSQDPARVRETVLHAHTDADRVRRLVEASPALANAAIDWGFGDWESALGAASHMGRRDIAEVLIGHGARPDLFTHAMMGNLAVVRAIVEARPGIQGSLGPHGITLLAHARAGGEAARAVAEWLEALGGADPAHSSQPLPAPVAAYLGVYVYGPGPGESLEVAERDGLLRVRRGEGFPRTLFHLGGSEFHPAGVPALRLRFRLEGEGDERRAIELTVLDPEVVVVARRPPGAR